MPQSGTKKSLKLLAAGLLVGYVHVASAVSMWIPGTYIAVGAESQYRLPHPDPFPDGQLIKQVDRLSQYILTPPGVHDIDQTLSITVEAEGTDYLVVLGQTALVLYKQDTVDPELAYQSALAYTNIVSDSSYQPHRLLWSASNSDAFFLLSEGHLPQRFEIENGQLYRSQPGISAPPTSIGTVVHAHLPSDDVYAVVVDSNILRLYSVLSQRYVKTLRMAEYCDQITALHSLPPLDNDGNMSMVVSCTKDGQSLQYYVMADYQSPDSQPQQVHRLDHMGVPLATNTHLAIRHGNKTTIYDRRHMEEGVPRSHLTSLVHRVVPFKWNEESFFLVYQANRDLTLLPADRFFKTGTGVGTLPDTLQQSCDPVCLPYAISGSGLLVTSLTRGTSGSEESYAIVTLTYDPISSTLSESARVQSIPNPPALVNFIGSSNPTPDDPVTTPATSPSPPPPTVTTPTPTVTTPTPTGITPIQPPTRALSTGEVVGIAVGCVILLIVLVAVIACALCVKEKLTIHSKNVSRQYVENGIINPVDSSDRSDPVPSFDSNYPKPTPETGDDLSLPKTINQKPVTITFTQPVEAEDPGYSSAKQTPLPARLSPDGRHTESRLSTSSMGTLSTSIDCSSTEGDAYSVNSTCQ